MLGGYTVSADAFYDVLTASPIQPVFGTIRLTTIFPLNNADALCSPRVTVTDTGDSTPGSLRQALADVCDGGTVDLTRLPTPATITLQSRLYLSRNVVIQGPANGPVTISGNNLTRMFFMQSGNVIIADLTLANGFGKGGTRSGGGAGMGGAIFQNGGNLTLRNVVFSGNQAVGGSTNVPTANSCSGFGDNVANPSSIHGCAGDLGGAGNIFWEIFQGGPGPANGGDGETGTGGGGFAAGGSFNINPGSGGFPGGFGGGGGAPGEPATGGGSGGYGGGSSHGIIIQIPGSPVVVSTAGAGAGFGGAVFQRNGTLTLDSVIFQDNGAVGGMSGMNNVSPGQGKGGALFVYYGAKATLNNVTFSNNTAADAGKPGIGNSAAPYVNGATCPGMDNVNICGPVTGISAQLDGAIQATLPGNAFTPLSVVITDETGNRAPGIDVTFTAPSSGASGLFSNLSNVITVQTDANGVATAPFTANGVPGPFVVTAKTNSGTQTLALINSGQFIAAQTPGSLRNNYSGFVGFKFTVGPRPATAYALGRFVVAGNTQNHMVKLVQANGADVPNGSVILSTAGAAAET
ncbi:MAG: hypothetical protein ACJ8LM_16515, partial [Candidatus Udaeobacter sp.]